MNHIPVLSTDLIDELDKLYPEKCPSPKDGEREIWMYSGKRELVRFLKVRWEADQKEATDG